MISYRRVVNRMKKVCSPNKPLSVRRLKIPEHLDGDCQFKNGKYLIRIQRTLSESQQIDTFLHELAHAHAWNTEDDDHGEEWGRAYSKVYRTFLQEFLD